MNKIGNYIIAGIIGGVIVLAGSQVIKNNGEQTAEKTTDNKPQHVDSYKNHPPARVVNLTDAHPETSVDFTYASESTVNAVVHIMTEYETDYSQNPYYEYFYGPGYGKRKASGSGVILSEDGYIVTNNHVVEDADKIEVTLNDNRKVEAELIGTDPATDLALVKIEADNLHTVPLANSDEVRVGEWVLAVGNPFNLTSTVTAGIVSAKARSINILEYDPEREIFPIESFIQTDAAVNPGNSGGALVNAKGELVGINTAIASRTGSYSGYSFAVPVNIMKKVTEDLLEYGMVQRAFIGVNIRDIDQELADRMEIDHLEGVYVSRTIEGGAAESAGIAEGDIITKIGNVDVKNVPELQEQIGRFRPGDEVAVTVRRADKERVVRITLRNKDGSTDIVTKPKHEILTALGATFETATSKELKSLNLDGGVKVKDISTGKLRSAGIKEGFIITMIDQTKVYSPEQIVEMLEDKEGGVLIEGVYPNGMKGYYGFGM